MKIKSGPNPENVHISKELLSEIRREKLCNSRRKMKTLQGEIFKHEASPGIPGRPKYYIDCAGFAHMISITQAQIDAEAIFFPNYYKLLKAG